jgi:hypothetical protein
LDPINENVLLERFSHSVGPEVFEQRPGGTDVRDQGPEFWRPIVQTRSKFMKSARHAMLDAC